LFVCAPQDILDGLPPASGDELPAADVALLRPALGLLKRLSDQLRAARLAAGAIELESLELKFKVRCDTYQALAHQQLRVPPGYRRVYVHG
jgi:exoribonuclease R